jgi:hypothetical protein
MGEIDDDRPNSVVGFDFGARVVVRTILRTQSDGTAGWHGSVVGKSYDDDAPEVILGYGVAMDEDNELVWSVEPDDLTPEATSTA